MAFAWMKEPAPSFQQPTSPLDRPGARTAGRSRPPGTDNDPRESEGLDGGGAGVRRGAGFSGAFLGQTAPVPRVHPAASCRSMCGCGGPCDVGVAG